MVEGRRENPSEDLTEGWKIQYLDRPCPAAACAEAGLSWPSACRIEQSGRFQVTSRSSTS